MCIRDRRKRERQVVVLHGAHEVLPLRIAEEEDHDTVEAVAVVLGGQRFDVLARKGDAREDELRRVR